MFARLKPFIYNFLSVWYFRKKDFTKAEKYAKYQIEIAKRQHNKRAEAILYGNLALIYKEKGEFEKSIHLCESALQHNIKEDEKFFLFHIAGESAYQLADYSRAQNYLTKAEELAVYLGQMKRLIEIKYLLGLSYALDRDKEKAISKIKESLRIAQDQKSFFQEGYMNFYLGTVYETFGEKDKSRIYYEEAMRIFRKIGAKENLAEVQKRLQ